eukprot:GHUV01023013.1.p1 GENE.GHUV01023013.1~~GHUV01023013.1.p1  ORF type:complete len:148 (+),score=14.08 GHUV01023013.1:789-1232(+)
MGLQLVVSAIMSGLVYVTLVESTLLPITSHNIKHLQAQATQFCIHSSSQCNRTAAFVTGQSSLLSGSRDLSHYSRVVSGKVRSTEWVLVSKAWALLCDPGFKQSCATTSGTCVIVTDVLYGHFVLGLASDQQMVQQKSDQKLQWLGA